MEKMKVKMGMSTSWAPEGEPGMAGGPGRERCGRGAGGAAWNTARGRRGWGREPSQLPGRRE